MNAEANSGTMQGAGPLEQHLHVKPTVGNDNLANMNTAKAAVTQTNAIIMAHRAGLQYRARAPLQVQATSPAHIISVSATAAGSLAPLQAITKPFASLHCG